MFGKVMGVVLSAFLIVVATSCSAFALPLANEFQHRQCSVFVLDADAIDGECLLGSLSLLPQEKTGVPVSSSLSQGPHRPDGYRHLPLSGFSKQLTMALVNRHAQDVSRGSSDMLYGGIAFDKLAETVQTIPEPSTMMLLGAGLVTLAGVIRRRMERR